MFNGAKAAVWGGGDAKEAQSVCWWVLPVYARVWAFRGHCLRGVSLAGWLVRVGPLPLSSQGLCLPSLSLPRRRQQSVTVSHPHGPEVPRVRTAPRDMGSAPQGLPSVAHRCRSGQWALLENSHRRAARVPRW